jgi:hypothetical protein
VKANWNLWLLAVKMTRKSLFCDDGGNQFGVDGKKEF